MAQFDMDDVVIDRRPGRKPVLGVRVGKNVSKLFTAVDEESAEIFEGMLERDRARRSTSGSPTTAG